MNVIDQERRICVTYLGRRRPDSSRIGELTRRRVEATGGAEGHAACSAVSRLGATSAALLLACSGADGGEDLGRLAQRLSDTDRVLGFEAPSADWTSPQVTGSRVTPPYRSQRALSVIPLWLDGNIVHSFDELGNGR